MYNTPWVDRPAKSLNKPSPEELVLKETYLKAQNVSLSLLCASTQFQQTNSPEVATCAALIRAAVHKPEEERVAAIKAAEKAVLARQIDYVSSRVCYQRSADEWMTLRPALVAGLEAVALTEDTCQSPWVSGLVDIEFCLNCESVVALIESSDIAINDASSRHNYSRPTQRLAEAAFQKVFDAMVAEVGREHWMTEARLSCYWRHSNIFPTLPVENISSLNLPAQYEKCKALDVAREALEGELCYATSFEEFQKTMWETLNDTQFAERLLCAMPNAGAMQLIEEQRDEKLRGYYRRWRSIRHRLDYGFTLFIKVVEAMPEALAEAAAIENESMRRMAQNQCLFAARRLKEKVNYIRNRDRWVADFVPEDVSAAACRSQKALVERIKSKEFDRLTNRRKPEPYMG